MFFPSSFISLKGHSRIKWQPFSLSSTSPGFAAVRLSPFKRFPAGSVHLCERQCWSVIPGRRTGQDLLAGFCSVVAFHRRAECLLGEEGMELLGQETVG